MPMIRMMAVAALSIAGCAGRAGPGLRAERSAPGGGYGGGAPPVELLRPAHTYSIVARDPKTGELGVAVQSHWFGVGKSVAWAEAGVGAVATQSFVDPAYGPRGLSLICLLYTSPSPRDS